MVRSTKLTDGLTTRLRAAIESSAFAWLGSRPGHGRGVAGPDRPADLDAAVSHAGAGLGAPVGPLQEDDPKGGPSEEASTRVTGSSIAQRVRDALDHHAIPPTSGESYGYRVEDGLDGSTIVRWGRGRPFTGVHPAWGGRALERCRAVLRNEGFRVAPAGPRDPRVRSDTDSLYLVVTEVASERQ